VCFESTKDCTQALAGGDPCGKSRAAVAWDSIASACPRQVLVDEAGRVTAKKGEEAPSRPGNFLQRVSASMLPGRPDNA
jgi:hypothetical protein